MITGFAKLFLNAFYLLGFIVLLIIIVGAIGILKDFIKALFVRGALSRLQRKLIKIEKHADKIIRDFHQGANFMGLAETTKLGEELNELESLCKEMENQSKKKKV